MLPQLRSEQLPSHLAPSKEEIEKEQYANLPDKLLTTMNKDKKPFTYTPQGVSGVEKGKLDLTEIRSPKMKKRLMANLHENDDSSDNDRPRSETPDLLTKPQTMPNPRRAITPDVVMLNRQTYIPVLPVLPVKDPVFPDDRNSYNIYRQSPLAEDHKHQQQALVKQKLQQQSLQKPLITPQIMDSLMFKQLEGLKKSYKPDISTFEAVNSNGKLNENLSPENVSFLYPKSSVSDTESKIESSDEVLNEENVQQLPEQVNAEITRNQVKIVDNNNTINNETYNITENTNASEAKDNEVNVNTSYGNVDESERLPAMQPPMPPPMPPPLPPPLPPPTLQQQQYLLKQQQLQQQQQLLLQQQQEQQQVQQQQHQQLLYQQQLLQQQQQQEMQRQQQQQNYYSQVNGNNSLNTNDEKIISDSIDVNAKPSSQWENDVLRHVLDGGLQEELEKFEQISLEAEQCSSRTSTPLQYNRNIYCNEPQTQLQSQPQSQHQQNARIEETYDRIDLEAPTIETAPIKFKDAREMFKRIQDLDKKSEAVSFNAFRRNRSPQPQQSSRDSPITTNQSMWSSAQDWTRYQSPPPTPTPTPFSPQTTYPTNSFNSHDTQDSQQTSDHSLYRGGHIPSKTFQYIKEKTGITDAEVKNYNTRAKPFYLSSLSPTPQPTQSSQQFYKPQQNPSQSSSYGVNIPPPKIDYLETTEAPIPAPQRKSYIEGSSMYSQLTYANEWPESGVDYSSPLGSSNSKSGSEYQCDYNSPKAAAARRKKLPPSQQECDPTPPKYQGSSIPSRSFRFLQLITGEDIENQYQNNHESDYKKPSNSKLKPNIKPTKPPPNIPNPLRNTELQPPFPYRTYDDSGTDF